LSDFRYRFLTESEHNELKSEINATLQQLPKVLNKYTSCDEDIKKWVQNVQLEGNRIHFMYSRSPLNYDRTEEDDLLDMKTLTTPVKK
jgi:hypothetical protein